MTRSKVRINTESERNQLTYYIIVGLVAFIVYSNSLSNAFVFDDESVVLSDPSITQLSNIPKFFTGQEGFHKVIGRYYRPVVSLSYTIDCAIWGLKPFGFHLTNVLIHVINSLIVLRILMLLFPGRRGSQSKRSLLIPIVGALIFAVHPIHTEAVAWVSGRTDSLAFTFFGLSFIYFLKYAHVDEQKNKSRYIFLFGLYYVFALLSKEMAITLPFVILAYDVLIEKRSLKELKSRSMVYVLMFGVSILYLIARWLVLKDVPERESYNYFFGKDFATTFFTMFQTIPLYLRLLVYPVGLLYHYSGYSPYVNSFANDGVIFSLIVVVVMGTIVILCLKKHQFVSFSILFFFITILPVMNIIPTMNFVAERFLYISSLSVVILIPYLLSLTESKKIYSYSAGIGFAVVALFGVLTLLRNGDWKSNDTLFLSAEGKPGTVTYVNIGNIYANKQQFDIAEQYYRKAIDLRGETLLANNNLGKIFMVKGNYDSALYYFRKSVQLDTLSPEPRYSMVQLYVQNNMIKEAIAELENILRIVPDYMNSKEMLVELKKRVQTGSDNPGKEQMNPDATKIQQLESESYSSYRNKNYEMAIKELAELVKINPSASSSYYNNIGMCYMDQNNLGEAKHYFELSVKSNDHFSTAFNNLGSVYEKMGDKENARKNYKLALDADPGNTSAKENYEKLK